MAHKETKMGYNGSEADIAYRKQYKKEHKKAYTLNLYDTKDKQMIDYIATKRPVGAYLKNLVKKDMEQTTPQ